MSSSIVMPLISSEVIEADAWLIAQPWPEKRRSSILPSSVVRISTVSSSPQSGLESLKVRSCGSRWPQLCGRL